MFSPNPTPLAHTLKPRGISSSPLPLLEVLHGWTQVAGCHHVYLLVDAVFGDHRMIPVRQHTEGINSTVHVTMTHSLHIHLRCVCVYLMTRSWSLTRDSRWPSWLVTSSMTGIVLGYFPASSSAWVNNTDAKTQDDMDTSREIDGRGERWVKFKAEKKKKNGPGLEPRHTLHLIK